MIFLLNLFPDHVLDVIDDGCCTVILHINLPDLIGQHRLDHAAGRFLVVPGLSDAETLEEGSDVTAYFNADRIILATLC